MKEDATRKRRFKAAIDRVNKDHGKTLQKLGGGVNNRTFIAAVNAFIERYRSALKRLSKK